jgi:hypothetical protein
MKKLIIIIFTLFISHLANAESVRDFEGDEKIKLNESYKCVNFTDKKAKFKFGFHEIEGTTFAFLYTEEAAHTAFAAARVYKSKVKNREVISYVFPYPTDGGLVGVIFTKNWNKKNEKLFFMKWIKDDTSIDWVNEHFNLWDDNSKNINQKYIDFSEKALDVIFRIFEFGTPFHPDDILTIPDEKLIGGDFFTCK